MTITIRGLRALEILDSRGNPTLSVTATLSNGVQATAQVPSGASTGRHEAHELRDGDPARYGGKGVRQAAAHVEREIASVLEGLSIQDLPAIDRRLAALDGTSDKSRLGANALLGTSCALARAAAAANAVPLWEMLRAAYGGPAPASIPVPMINILSGGHHAGRNIEFQDFLAFPIGFVSYSEALHAAVAVHRAARELLDAAGYSLTGVADEGGWGPLLPSNETALDILSRAIERAGYRAGDQVAIAVDAASSHFYAEGNYVLRTEARSLTSSGMTDLLEQWSRRYPIRSIEDGLEQDDWAGWRELTARLGASMQLVGDDFLTTNPGRVARAVQERSANAVLVKMNQIGTLLETFEVLRMAAVAGWNAVVSARSGETEDSFLADLAIASGAGQIKVGSITRSERLAKYNRLLEVERDGALPFARFAIPPG